MSTSSEGRSVRRARRPFTPSQEPPTELSARTVGRDEIIELSVNRLRRAASSGTRVHTLYLGPRGSGKTHLVEVVLHRSLADPEVASKLVVARADEDAVGLTRFEDLLDVALTALEQPTPRRHPDSRESRISAALDGRVLVLIVENLDRVFDAIGLAGQRAMRAWVETSGEVLLLATSPLLIPSLSMRSAPWYGGLAVSHLPELTVEEGREMLRHLAATSGDAELADFLESDTAVNRMKAIDALAGGSPRVWMILSECLSVESLDELTPAVEDLLEGLVPYYQQLLWDLSPNEQRIVRALAGGDSAGATVGEIAGIAALDGAVTGTTLRRLTESTWVTATKVPGLDQRTTWYRLREPLLRHHFRYRDSRRDGTLRLIVEILRTWHDPQHEGLHDVLTSAVSRAGTGLGSLVETFRAAVDGSAEALARLPSELVAIVKEMRETERSA